jgi:hypothetical protein
VYILASKSTEAAHYLALSILSRRLCMRLGRPLLPPVRLAKP